jgi:hypothetical protein
VIAAIRERELRVDRLGDVVVAAPVGGPLGVRELVQKMPAQVGGQPARGRHHGGRIRDEVALRSLELDERDLLRRRLLRHHRDERQPEHAREVRLADRRRPRGRLDHGRVRADPAVAQGVQE